MSYGIDVSNNNTPGSVDWDGVQFCFIKASESVSFVDKFYSTFRGECQRRQIPWAPYHFAHPDVNSAAAEASFFLSTWFHSEADRPPIAPALDIEIRGDINPLVIMGAGKLAAWIDEFNSHVRNAVGVSPFIYMFRSYAKTLMPLVSREWPLWLSTAAGSPNYPYYAGRQVAIEQYSNEGGLDRNESYIPLIPGDDEDMVPAKQWRIPDGRVFAVPVNGSKPWHIKGEAIQGALVLAKVIEGDVADITDPQQATELAASASCDCAGGGSQTAHFVGTVDLHAAP